VQVLQDGENHVGRIQSIPMDDEENYIIMFADSPQPYEVPIEQITSEDEPTFHMMSIDPDEEITNSLPMLPEWIHHDTHVTIHAGHERKGNLVNTDKG
jgi:hypothetical protein